MKLAETLGQGMTIWEYVSQSEAVQGYVNGNRKTVGGYTATLDVLIEFLEGV